MVAELHSALIGHFRNRRQLGQSVGPALEAPETECANPDNPLWIVGQRPTLASSRPTRKTLTP